MTKPTATLPDCITILAESLTLAGEVRGRGDVVELTPELIEATTDRNGHTVLAMADDERAQVDLWGRRMFMPGDHRAAMLREQESDRAQRERTIDPDGALEALRSEWAAEDRARAAAKSNAASRTTSGV